MYIGSAKERIKSMKDIKIGYIGLGGRGLSFLSAAVLPQGEAVTAVCDLYEDRMEKGAECVFKKQGTKPAMYKDYRDVIADPNVNTVIIASAWDSHVEMAVAAMRAGKAVALEVGGAYGIDQCFKLVEVYEETKTPFMFLENCCYGRREMMVLNMVKQGVFGEIVHCAGGYQHDLRSEIAGGRENRHYRLRNYISRNCECYPTHEIGPIARILDLNRGNRMVTLCSMASKAAGLKAYIKKEKSDDEFLMNQDFAQGDIVTTIIKCARGGQVVDFPDFTHGKWLLNNAD